MSDWKKTGVPGNRMTSTELAQKLAAARARARIAREATAEAMAEEMAAAAEVQELEGEERSMARRSSLW